jgi:hypothetical protein
MSDSINEEVEAHHIISEAMNEAINSSGVSSLVICMQHVSNGEIVTSNYTYGSDATNIGMIEMIKSKLLIQYEEQD